MSANSHQYQKKIRNISEPSSREVLIRSTLQAVLCDSSIEMTNYYSTEHQKVNPTGKDWRHSNREYRHNRFSDEIWDLSVFVTKNSSPSIQLKNISQEERMAMYLMLQAGMRISGIQKVLNAKVNVTENLGKARR